MIYIPRTLSTCLLFRTTSSDHLSLCERSVKVSCSVMTYKSPRKSSWTLPKRTASCNSDGFRDASFLVTWPMTPTLAPYTLYCDLLVSDSKSSSFYPITNHIPICQPQSDSIPNKAASVYLALPDNSPGMQSTMRLVFDLCYTAYGTTRCYRSTLNRLASAMLPVIFTHHAIHEEQCPFPSEL